MMLTPWCLLAFATFAAPVESVAVEVDASTIEPEGPGITRQLGKKVTTALAEQGVSVDDASSNHLRIEVRRTSVMSYDVTFVVEVGGAVVQPELEHVTCNRCPLTRMDEAVLAKLPDTLALMEQAAEPEPVAQVEDAQAPVEVEPAEDPAEPEEREEPTRTTKKGRLLGPLGVTGIVVGGAGLGAVVAGATLLAKGVVRSQDPLANELGTVEDFRPAGRIWVSVGAAAAVVGGAFLAVDLTILRRRRTVAMVPVVSPRYTGLTVEARF